MAYQKGTTMNLEGTPLETYDEEWTKQYNAIAATTKGGIGPSQIYWLSTIFSFFKLMVDWVQANPKEGEPRMAQPNPFDLDARTHI
jgi:hypothetical protein